MGKVKHIVLTAAGLTLSLGAVAEEGGTAEGLPLWELGVGVAAYDLPSYPGADQRSTTYLPFPYVIYRGEWFRIDRGLEGILVETERLKLDFSARASAPMEGDGDTARRGMPDLDPAVQVGPSVNILLSDPGRSDNLWGSVAVRSMTSAELSDWTFTHQGWVLDTRLRYQMPVATGTSLSLGGGVLFADRGYTGYYYDVPPEYADAGRPTYRADAGYAGAHLGVGLDGRHGRLRWAVFGSYEDLHGTAFADSPLVENKSDFTVGATVAWVFWESERRVKRKNTSPGGEFEVPLFGR